MTGPNRGIGTSLTFIRSFLPESTFTIDFRKYVVVPQDPTVTETDKKTQGVVIDFLIALDKYLGCVMTATYDSLPTKAVVLRFLGYNPKAAYHTPFADVSTMWVVLEWQAVTFPIVILKKAYTWYTQFNSVPTDPLAKYNESGINTAHIYTKNLEFNDADVPAEIQVDNLFTLFDEINFKDPAAPNYKDPASLIETTTLKATEVPRRYSPDELRGGIRQFIEHVKNKTPFLGTAQENNKEKLEKMYKGVTVCVRLTLHLLAEEKKKFLEANGTDPTQYNEEQRKEYGNMLATRKQIALDFGMAGLACGSRYTATSEEIYRNLKGPSLNGTLIDNLGEILALFRKAISLQQTYGQNAHIFNRYLVELGELLAIPGSRGITEELISSLPHPREYYIEQFFELYTVSTIIRTIQNFVITTDKEKAHVALSTKLCNNLRDWVKEQLDTGTNTQWLPEVYDKQQKILSNYKRLLTEITDEVIEIIYDDDDDKEARIQEKLALSSDNIRKILFKETEEAALKKNQEELNKKQSTVLKALYSLFNALYIQPGVEWTEKQKTEEARRLLQENQIFELKFEEVKLQNRETIHQLIKSYLDVEIVQKFSHEGTKRERFVKYEEYVTETVAEVRNVIDANVVDVSRQTKAFEQLRMFITTLQALCPHATAMDDGAIAYWTSIFQGEPASEEGPEPTIASLLYFIDYTRTKAPLTGSEWKAFLNEARALLNDIPTTAITRPSFNEIHRLVGFCQEQTQNEKFQTLVAPLFNGTTLENDQIREVFIRHQKINMICRLVNLSSFTINKILDGADLEEPVRDAIDQERRTAFLHELNLDALQEKGIPPNLLEWILVDQRILHPQKHLLHTAPAPVKKDHVDLTIAELLFRERIFRKFSYVDSAAELDSNLSSIEKKLRESPDPDTRASLSLYAQNLLHSSNIRQERMVDSFIVEQMYASQQGEKAKRVPFPILDQRKYITDYIFNYTYTLFPEHVIAEAEKAAENQGEFYPNSFAKKVCWEHIPLAMAALTPLFKIAVVLGLAYAYLAVTTRAAKTASTFTATKLMPFITKNAPPALLITCRKVIDAIPDIFKNPTFTPFTFITFYKNNPNASKNIIPIIYDVTRAVVTEGSKPFKITEIFSNTVIRISASISIRNVVIFPDFINDFQSLTNNLIAAFDAPRWMRLSREQQAAHAQQESNAGAPTSETPASSPTIPERVVKTIKQIPSLLMKTAKAALPVLKLLSAEFWSLHLLQTRFLVTIHEIVLARFDATSSYFRQCAHDAKKKRLEACKSKAYAVWCKVTDPNLD